MTLPLLAEIAESFAIAHIFFLVLHSLLVHDCMTLRKDAFENNYS